MGYKFQSSRSPASTRLNYSMFELAHGYARNNMTAFVELQQKEFRRGGEGLTAVKHQREVGTSYFDQVTQVVTAGKASTTALTARPRTSSSSARTRSASRRRRPKARRVKWVRHRKS